MRKCFASHGVRLTGVLHVGGHFGEEYPIYKAAGAQRVVFFEPMPHIFMELRRRFGSHEDVTLVKQALGSKRETLRMHVNRFAGESSSFLRPSALYDGFFRRSRLSLSVDTLDAALLALGGPSGFDLLVTDTQGFDLEVLRGAKKALPLAVAGAYHSPLMAAAQPKLHAALAAIPLLIPAVPVVSNVTARPHSAPSDIHQRLVEQVTSSVRWEDSMRYLLAQGFTRFIELGPGKALSGFMKRIDPAAQMLNVSDVASLEATVKALGA